jgi:hypothetical protein
MAEYVLFKPTAPQKHGLEALATRPDTLDGKTIGLLFNAKVNADIFLARIKERLSAKYPTARFVNASKPTASKPMEPEVVAVMSKCDVVVNAFGD